MSERSCFAAALSYWLLNARGFDPFCVPVALEHHTIKHIHQQGLTHCAIRDHLIGASTRTRKLMAAALPKHEKVVRGDTLTGGGYVRIAAWRRPSHFHKGIRHLRALVHAQFVLTSSATLDPEIPFPNGRPSVPPLVMSMRLLDVHTQPDGELELGPVLDLCGAALCSDLIHQLDPPLRAIEETESADGLYRAPYAILFRFALQGDLSDSTQRRILASAAKHFSAACEGRDGQPDILKGFLVDEELNIGLEQIGPARSDAIAELLLKDSDIA